MARLACSWILFLLGVFLCATSLEAVELQKLPAPGGSFSGRIELRESQEFLEHWSREPRFSRRFSLTAEITWTVRQVKKESAVLEGRVTEGLYSHALAGFIELEEVYGLILDSLVFHLRLSSGESRLQVDKSSLQRVLRRFEKGQAARRLPEGMKKRIVEAFLDRFELAQRVGYWLLFKDSRKEIQQDELFRRRLAGRGGKPSGTMIFTACPWTSRSFAGAKGREMLVRRIHFPTPGGPVRSSGYGTLAWLAGEDGPPYRCHLKVSGDYSDPAEMKDVVDFTRDYRQRHSLEFFMGARGEASPSASRFTGLPARLQLPVVGLDLLSASEKKELDRYLKKASVDGESLLKVIAEYLRMEKGSDAGKPLCAALHFALADLLALSLPARKGPLPHFTERVVERSRSLAEYLLVLRAVASPYAGYSDSGRLEVFRVALARRSTNFARWGGMLLAQGAWPGAAELLLGSLEGMDNARLERSFRLDLQRLAGAPVAGLEAAKIRELVKARKAEPGRQLFLPARLQGGQPGLLFNEAGTGAVYLVDSSRPYERSSLSRKRGVAPPPTDRTRSIYLALRESLKKIPPELRFAMAKFHAGALLRKGWAQTDPGPWKKDALDFVAAELDPGKDPRNVSRARYAVGLKAVLSGFPEAEVIILVTDFDRGDYWEAESVFLARNYLRGVRLVTYGWKKDPALDSSRLSFLERLAGNHHGWFRLLD